MTIAVTSVSGQLGTAIAKALLAMDSVDTIVGLARSPDKVRDLPIEIRPGNYADQKQLQSSLVIAELGEFMGTVIAGIYQGIHDGALDHSSDFETAAGRPHQSWNDYFASLQR